jgi:RHS repeat-associated protein
MTWDHLGRLTAVTTGSGTTTYSYDPLDRLRTVDYGGGSRIRFRYVGMTTAAAQWLDDVAGTVTRSIGNGWGGERLLDWTGTSSNRRYYGDNAHHDVTWFADSTGAVSQSLRYDPWGTPRSTPPSGYTPFRFQGSWHDATTDLAWVVTRWYAPSLGRFVSEDTLLGEPREPDSRHLYAYAAGEPVGRWDPDGRRSAALIWRLTDWHFGRSLSGRAVEKINAAVTAACWLGGAALPTFITGLIVGGICLGTLQVINGFGPKQFESQVFEKFETYKAARPYDAVRKQIWRGWKTWTLAYASPNGDHKVWYEDFVKPRHPWKEYEWHFSPKFRNAGFVDACLRPGEYSMCYRGATSYREIFRGKNGDGRIKRDYRSPHWPGYVPAPPEGGPYAG